MKSRFLIVWFLFGGWMLGMTQNLNWLLTQAANRNPDLKAIQYAYEAQRQRIAPAGALSDPEIGVGLFPMPMQRWMGRQWVDISLRQKFPWKGTLPAAQTVEEKKADGVLRKYDQLKAEIFYQIKQEWWSLQLMAFKAEVLEKHLNLIAVLKDLAEEKIANNLLPTGQFIELKLQENERINQLETINQQMVVAQLNIIQLTQASDWVFEPLDEWNWPSFPEEALSEFASSNPEMQVNRNEMGVYESLEHWNKLKSKPSFGVGLQYSLMSKVDRPDLNPKMNGMDMLMPMATISVPINQKKYHAAVQEMKWYQRSKEETLESLSDYFSTQIQTNLLNYQNADRNLKYYQTQTSLLEDLAELQIAAFANGTGSLEMVMSTRQRLLDLQIKTLETKWEAEQIIFEVEKILGR
ncbi:MAG: TolC family protein [Saprospiraceae bacterium]